MYQEKNGANNDRAGLVRSLFSEDDEVRPGDGDLKEQVGSIREDLELLKAEIKQTLIDLREVVMKNRTISMDHTFSVGTGIPQIEDMPGEYREAPYLTQGCEAGFTAGHYAEVEDSGDRFTLKEMGDVFQWILEVKEAGLPPTKLAEFLDAYALLSERLTRFVVKIIQEMKDDDPEGSSSVSLDTYGPYIARLARFLARPERDERSHTERVSGRPKSDGDAKPKSDISRETTNVEVNRGQGDSHGFADDSFDHGCSHCDQWHDSGHK